MPSQFAGRKDEIAQLVDSLSIDGSCPVIYGDRGVGKTSLAFQIERIALGDTELLDELEMSERAMAAEDCFATFYFSCTDAIQSKDELLQRLINTAEGFTSATALPRNILKSRQTKKTLKLKFYEHEVSESYAPKRSDQKFKNLSIEEKLQLISERIVEAEQKRVLFIIDELDRVRSTRGLASFIKSTSSRDLKFLLVGVGHNVSALLLDHASVSRALIQVAVSRMRDEDSEIILRKAQAIAHQAGVKIEFSVAVIKRIVAASGGFPWFVHTIGQEAFLLAFEARRGHVAEADVDTAIARLGTKRFGQQFYDTYQMAVRDSSQREIVLRLFAKWDEPDIPTSEVYPLAEALAVTNPSVLATQLTENRYGGVLVRPPYAEARFFRFTNTMFQRYVNLRGSVYSQVKEDVDRIWAKREE